MNAYFDCFSGISGDMTLGALVDMGAPEKRVIQTLKDMPLSGFDLTFRQVMRGGIRALKADVAVYQAEHARDYADIRGLIKSAAVPENVRTKSLSIFLRIAEAEARIHDCPLDKVHFHELGGTDAIVDIVGSALCLEYLGIRKVIASPLPLGSGFVTCSHGQMPVPAPATLEILKGFPVSAAPADNQQTGELVTPTGAAILAEITDSWDTLPRMIPEQIGYGAGERDSETLPNVLRVIAGPACLCGKDRVWVIETCIDDMNPEIFSFLMDRLFEDGALDVCWIPAMMKKNRPATLVKVICAPDRRDVIMHRMLTESTTLGVRYYEAERAVLARETIEIKTEFGLIPVKKITDPTGCVRMVPEYEICRQLALEKKIPVRVVYDRIYAEALNSPAGTIP